MNFRAKPVVFSLALVITVAALLAWLFEAQARRDRVRKAQFHLDRGIHLYNQKALLDAELEFRRALRTDPKNWRAPFYVGAVEVALRRYGLAIPYLERALSLNPTEPKILNGLGVVYFKLGRIDMAKGYFWAALDLDPGNSDAKGLMETMAKLQLRAERAALSEKRD